jgi:UDPglucose 6-dehydrogenase
VAALPEMMKTPLIFDGRNQYSPLAMQSMGFEYVCVGRC